MLIWMCLMVLIWTAMIGAMRGWRAKPEAQPRSLIFVVSFCALPINAVVSLLYPLYLFLHSGSSERAIADVAINAFILPGVALSCVGITAAAFAKGRTRHLGLTSAVAGLLSWAGTVVLWDYVVEIFDIY